MYQIILLLLLPLICHTKIVLNITVATHLSSVVVKYADADNKLVTDHEIQLFNITIDNLNKGMKTELGLAPDNIFFHDPTPYGDLFKKFKWPEAKRNLRIVEAEVVDLIRKESILQTKEHINNSTLTVKALRSLSYDSESLIYSTYWPGGLPEENILYDVNVNFGYTTFKYENKWRDRIERSVPAKINVSKKGYISIKPGQTVVTNLKAFKTIITVKLVYRARIIGNLIGDYEELYGKYHFYSPTMSNIMKAAGLNNEIDTTEFLEIVCYSEPSLDVFDKDTGATVKSDVIPRIWLKKLPHRIH